MGRLHERPEWFIEKTCEYCKAQFLPARTNHGTQRFCCEYCQKKARVENLDRGKVHTHTCQNCGKEYQTKRVDKTTCCSRECGFEWLAKQARIEKECVSCGRIFEDIQSGADYCSDECKERGIERTCAVCDSKFYGHPLSIYCSRDCELEIGRSKYQEYMTEKVGERAYVCKECGKGFIAPYGDKRREFCSLKCSRLNYLKSPAGRETSARQQQKRRGQKYDNGPTHAIDRRAVFDRDGWRCGICGRPVNSSLKFPHPDSPSLDHIIPLAEGGTHTWQNVQLAHFICNSLKGSTGGGQLRLGITMVDMNREGA